MRTWGSAAAVIAALRDDAVVEIERLERDAAAARETLERTFTSAPSHPESDARVTAARRVAADNLAEEDWQDLVSAATDRDDWIAEVARRARAALATTPDLLAWTESLAVEASAAIAGEACILIVPANVVGLLGNRRAALEARTQKRITIEAGTLVAGCIARTPDGRVTFDNSIDARARRTQTIWRAALAKIYDAAVARSAPAEPVATGAAQP